MTTCQLFCNSTSTEIYNGYIMGLPAVLAAVSAAGIVVGLALWKCCTFLSNRNRQPTRPVREIDPATLTSATTVRNAYTSVLNQRSTGQGGVERE